MHGCSHREKRRVSFFVTHRLCCDGTPSPRGPTAFHVFSPTGKQLLFQFIIGSFWNSEFGMFLTLFV